MKSVRSRLVSLGSVALSCWLPTLVHAELLVGIAGPLTGNDDFLGEQQDLGAQRAITDLNAAGGVLGEDIGFISVDDACDADQAVATAKRLVAANVDLVIGHLCSRTTIAASEIYDAAGILMISPASTNPAVTDRGLPTVFRTIGRDDDQAAVAAAFMMAEFGDSNIALLHDDNTYGKGIVEGVRAELNAAGKDESLFALFEADRESYSSIVEAVVAAEVDLVYLAGNANDVALLTRQLKEGAPAATIISADAMAADGFYLIAGDAAIGTYFTFGPDARDALAAAGVVESFREEEAYEPEGYTLYSYAAVQAWAQAVESAGTASTEEVAAALKSGAFDTVIGEIGFDEKGDVTGVDNFVMYVWGAEGYRLVE